MVRAIGISRYGDASVLEQWDRPLTRPGPGEVLVRVEFAGINFMDVHTRQGKYATSHTYPVRLPTGLGMEGAGIVVEAGDGVSGFDAGARVAWCLSWGSYADYAIVPARRLAPVPPELELSQAAASIFQGLTAHYLAHDVGRLSPRSTCLVHAASGAVGRLLVQYAHALGATVIASTSSPAKAEIVRNLGADHVLRYDQPNLADQVRALTGGAGADVVYDAIGSPTLRESIRATAVRGLVVNYGSVAGNVDDLSPIELGEAGSLFLTRPRLADHVRDLETFRSRAASVFTALARGTLSVEPGPVYSFDRVAEAHAALEGRRQQGKSLLDPHR
ncbi:quinone oxidoreductase family protein [Actinacidiphila sp. ITFR-21]|uniref:quinone oxidoreductase family protein n=1 Tax=Actinacidiphila sp. ITFR-21 TaxID=3075199 RepID=UPI00288A91B7|nr:quinone oxidoreductase [Streptomyces sp. ITFR-21]WNI18753.1 quinone oxidoreductase [Streptomyces sp. ITFR-21]